MAKHNPNMDLKKIRKNVLNNLVERHSDKEADSDYWSMQLLIKLGLIPDPEGDGNDASAVEMTVEEREQKLKDVGLFLPKKNLEELNKELARVAAENYQKMVEESLNRLSREELQTLKKLGLKDDEIAKIGPGDNPFKDFALGDREDIIDLLDCQKGMYKALVKAYVADQAVEEEADDEVANVSGQSPESPKKKKKEKKPPDSPSVFKKFDKTPPDYHYWSKKKQFEFQRKKLLALQNFYFVEKDLIKKTKKSSFLRDYSKGEMALFEDYLEKMISSKAAEIFKQA